MFDLDMACRRTDTGGIPCGDRFLPTASGTEIIDTKKIAGNSSWVQIGQGPIFHCARM
jgi:hypothetical protein